MRTEVLSALVHFLHPKLTVEVVENWWASTDIKPGTLTAFVDVPETANFEVAAVDPREQMRLAPP